MNTSTKTESPDQRRRRLIEEARARAAEEKRLSAEWEREHNAGPGMTMVAGWPMFSPTARPDLSDDLWAALLLLQSADEVDADDVLAFIARAEAHMGTTDLHRIDAKEAAGLMSADEAEGERRAVRARISAEKRRQMLDQNRRAAGIDAPLRDPDFVQKIAAAEGKLLTAQTELEQLRADPKKNRKAIKRAENQVRGLTAKVAEIKGREQFTYDLLGPAREPLIRALARGEIVRAHEAETAEILVDEYGAKVIHRSGESRGLAVFKYSRAVRVKNLSGIDHAIAAGYFAKAHAKLRGVPPDDVLKRIAETYGEAYVVVEGKATHAGEGGGGFKPKAPIPRNVEAGETLADMRKNLTRRQRAVLDLVCGDGFRLREAADALHAGYPATLTALIAGLKAAEASRIAERERRDQSGEMPVGFRVQLANQMMRVVRA